MGLIFKIAWRNILRHKGKSFVIGIILFLGALLMTVGNGVISGMDKGLRANVINCFTGDVVIISDKQETDNVFMDMMGKAVEPIYNMVDIKKVLLQQDYVVKYLPAGKNMAIVLNEEGGTPGNAFLLGVDFEQYRTVFPGNVKVLEGRLPKLGEKGALVPTGARKEFYNYTSIWFMPENETLNTANLTPEALANKNDLTIKTNAVLMGLNNDNSTTDIRLGIKGVIKYKALNHIWGHFVLVDIESYRQCLGYFAASEKTTEITAEKKTLLALDNTNLDAMFSDDALMVKDTGKPLPSKLTPIKTAAPVSAAAVDLDAGAYNMIMVFFKKDQPLEEALKKLNMALKEAKLGVHAVSWKKAIGMVGSMATLIKGALFVFVMFLFFVAIIIIVNTLSMAALERTSEIGMMRAVGAKKSFISQMFVGETAMLSFVFGGLGMVAGIITINILTLCHITSENDMVQLLFGGDTFHPFLSATDIMLVIVQLAIVTGIAVLYPMKVARGITPLDAVTRD
jgi:putative ABC transport system permease protein